MNTFELIAKLQGLMVDTFQSLASSVSSSDLSAIQTASNAVVEWLVRGWQDGSFTLLEVASRAAHFDVLIDALAQAYVNGYVTLLDIARIAANFITAYS